MCSCVCGFVVTGAWGFGCANTGLTEGLACEISDDCFPGQECIEGVCGGPMASDGSGAGDGDGDGQDDGGDDNGDGDGDGDGASRSVVIYTGVAAGGGLTSDSLTAAFEADGHVVQSLASVGSSDLTEVDTLLFLNPLAAIDSGTTSAAASFVSGGGRVVLLTDECKTNCISSPEDSSNLLSAIGSTMSVSGEGGTEGEADVAIVPYAPYTDGVTFLTVTDTGSIDVGEEGISLGLVEETGQRTPPASNVVLAVEFVGSGEVLVLSDVDLFVDVSTSIDNAAMLANLP